LWLVSAREDNLGGHVILERETQLGELNQLLDDVASSGGRIVLIRGEAGIGKSTLVARFLEDSGQRAHTLLGTCDDLITPQPFGPIWDVARQDRSLAEPLATGDRRTIMEATLDLLSRSLRPSVLVLEDTQWADDATLDLITFLGRRIGRANGLLLLTYRDIEVDADHPLRRVIGDLPSQNLVRMPLSRLTAEAVASMIEDDSFDVDEIIRLTGGNPLFVTEVLASGTGAVPLSVKDAVLARASKLSTLARQVLDLISVVPGEAETPLLATIVEPTDAQLAEGVHQGLLRVEDTAVSFTHDLQRRAVESELSASDRRSLNQQVLNALEASANPSRLVHHANEAGDIDAIIEYAPLAGRAAMAIESTREAVSHFRTLEPYLDRMEAPDQAGILSDWGAQEYHLDNPQSVELLDQAIARYRVVEDDHGLARTLTMASRVNRTYGNLSAALTYGTEAVSILEPYGPSLDLVGALSHRAFLEFVYTDDADAIPTLVDQAVSVAEEVGDDRAMVFALNTKAHLMYSRGDSNGMALMEESLLSAVRAGDHQGEVRALGNMAGMYGDVRDVTRATDFAQRALSTAVRYEIRYMEVVYLAMQAEFLLWRGDWAAAEDSATAALGSNRDTELVAWRVLGNIQSRRGRNEARTAIQHMWSLVQADDGPTVIDPAAAAIAEYLWLSGDDEPELVERLSEILAEGISVGTPWPSGAFAFWMWKLGLLEFAPEGTADFYGWIIAGDYTRAAAFWHDRGIPYEEGLALMHGNDNEQIEAIRIFEQFGATATANKVRQVLGERGVTVPRGKAQSTRQHAAGLTARQAEVLDLLAEGLTNAQIADRLFVSLRTAENHVSAVLMKLDVTDREAAVSAGLDRGILTVSI
jgi:DNA-binding CsgD family transcriptional regulator/tetratricopeptide (TPR) repeat protein